MIDLSLEIKLKMVMKKLHKESINVKEIKIIMAYKSISEKLSKISKTMINLD
jgi:hypothetical protein